MTTPDIEQIKPLTAEELAKVRARHEEDERDADRTREQMFDAAIQCFADRAALLATIDALSAPVTREEAARAIFKAFLPDCDPDRIAVLEETLAVQLALVYKQAEDEGLWFIAQTAPEAYLQKELRRLHYAIEANAASLGDKP